MLNAKWLPLERILLNRCVRTPEALFSLIACSVAAGRPELEERVRRRLARRHAWRPVTLGGCFALPHAAVPGLTTTHAVYVRASSAIPMTTPDGVGVTDALALLIPPPGLAADYDLLMNLTALITCRGGAASLRAATSAREIQAFLAGDVAP